MDITSTVNYSLFKIQAYALNGSYKNRVHINMLHFFLQEKRILFGVLIISMEQSPRLTSQEFLHIVWNLKVSYCLHSSPWFHPLLSWMTPYHTLTIYFKKHVNIIFSYVPESFKWSILFRFSEQIFHLFLCR